MVYKVTRSDSTLQRQGRDFEDRVAMLEESKESPAIVDRKALGTGIGISTKRRRKYLGSRTKDEEKGEPGISMCTVSTAEKDREDRRNRFQGRRWR